MLAIIAGQGDLPKLIKDRTKGPSLVVALQGFAPNDIDVDLSFRLENLGALLIELSRAGVRDVCFAGAVRRTVIDPAQIDDLTKPLIPKLTEALLGGDDGALRAIFAIFEDAGFNVTAAHELIPDLLPPVGCQTKRKPDQDIDDEVRRASEVLNMVGHADIGQSCAVHRGQMLAIEGVFGTDWMLESLKVRPDSGGGIFFKAPKPGQDRRGDLPVISSQTVAKAADAGLDGIVIEEGGVMVLDMSNAIKEADKRNIFLWVKRS